MVVLTMTMSRGSSGNRVVRIMTEQADDNRSVLDIWQRIGSNGGAGMVLAI